MRKKQRSLRVTDAGALWAIRDWKRFRGKHGLIIFSASLILWAHSPATADDTPPPLPLTSFGYTGLIEMPSARMAHDGAFTSGASFFKHNERYEFGFQVLPWLQTSFLYGGQVDFQSNTYGPIEWDRSFNIKARLWNETDILPAVAVGLNDFVGTGLYSGEYLVASKQLGDFDATIGLGTGVLATANHFKNPLSLIFKSFSSRINTVTGVGQFSVSDYFKGPVGIFGGVDWRTPLDRLTLIAEYSSNNYAQQSAGGSFTPRSQFNFGASYQISDDVTLGLQWLYGRSLGGSIAIDTDPTTDPFPTHIGPAIPPVHIRTPQEQQQALHNLLDLRDGIVRVTGISPDDRNALVDALWSNGSSDVSIDGRSLLVRSSGGDAQRLCQDTAHLVARYAISVDTVEVLGNPRTQRCAVPAQFHATVLSTDPGHTNSAGIVQIAPSLLTIDASASTAPSTKDALAAIRADAAKQQIAVQAVSLTDTEATIYYSNLKYFHERDAIDRLVRVLMVDTPAGIEKFRLIATLSGVPQQEFDLLRGPIEQSVAQTGQYSLDEGGNTISLPPMQNPTLAQAEHGTYPRYYWSIFPQFRQQLFDPSNPLGLQLLAGVTGQVEIYPGLALVAEGEANIWNDFATGRPSDSVLPHVRTDYLKYFTQGKNGIGDLEADYRFRIMPDVFAIARAGYLESMFAGTGGEVLWRPDGRRWALGADLYDVWQRDFDRLFGLQSYHVVTGHISLYYDSPWYNLNFALRAGRYLAGDIGLTLEMSRRFDTGVELGVFVTKTNVSAAEFGEGSFDKGFVIRIPIGWMVPINTQSVLATDIRPVQRDGGQRLDNDALLYGETQRSSYGEVIGISSNDFSPP